MTATAEADRMIEDALTEGTGGAYRLRSTMRPMHGQPVNWNARAIVWAGTDRRYWLRRGVGRLARLARGTGTIKATSHRYRVRYWLNRLTDDRDFPPERFTPCQRVLRRWLNTAADVEARKAWTATNRYWRQRERRRAQRSES